MENNIFTMDLDDELCLKPVPESFDDECDISENVLKDVEENKDDSLLFPGSAITVFAVIVLILSFSIKFFFIKWVFVTVVDAVSFAATI